jgi:alpha-N-arabinofuranosidase
LEKKAEFTFHAAYKIGDISPRLYSAFLEPIRLMVNGTMYNPKHPTADGKVFRHDVINALKGSGLPSVRLPGGNYVPGWDWKDSIAPKKNEKRILTSPCISISPTTSFLTRCIPSILGQAISTAR